MYLGVKMVLAKSIERIHKANLINFGIIPAVFVNPDDYEALGAGDELQAGNVHTALKAGNTLLLHNASRGMSFTVHVDITDRQRTILLAGGLINATKTV
jgi:aconitate hydratase